MEDEVTPEPDRSSEKVVRIPVEKWLKAISTEPPNVIITFNQELDAILQGGIHPGCMTELFGGKAVGKTTLCMQLCITVQLPRVIQGLDSEAIFIDTEQTFVPSRIKEMIYGCIQHCRRIAGYNSNLTAESLFNGVKVIPCTNLEELRQIVLDLDYYLCCHRKVKLVVLDSLAFLYYADANLSGKKLWLARSKSLYYFAQEFNRLINKYGIAVVLTNNMTTRIVQDGEKSEIPYLGPSWPYIPQVRIELQHERDRRQAVLHKTFACLPQDRTASFQIRTAGIR